jgi:hypothetical protein
VEFADPVSYFHPPAPQLNLGFSNHFFKVDWNYYLPDSAAKVYANLVGATLKSGIPVSYTDNPLLSASLPADLNRKGLEDWER